MSRLGRRGDGRFASIGTRRDGLTAQGVAELLSGASPRIVLHHGTLDTQRKIERFEADAIRYGNKALLAIAKGNPTNARLFAKEAAHAAYLAAAQE